MSKQEFIPCTIARAIGDGVFFRPIKSWHSATYAGEKLEYVPGSTDRSGCARKDEYDMWACSVPYTVTHRFYWHERDPTKIVSAFLSYPDAMWFSDGKYFWETYHISDDVERWFGDNAEQEMEAAIMAHFSALATA